MRRNIKWLSIAVAMVTVMLSVSGITFSKFESEKNRSAEPIRVIYEGENEYASLKPGRWVQESAHVVNESREAVSLRVHLLMPQTEDQPLFRLGRADTGVFVSLDSDSVRTKTEDEYWERVGDFFYYRNTKTGNRLNPGRRTISIYDAVQLSESVTASHLSARGEQSLILLAEFSPDAFE